MTTHESLARLDSALDGLESEIKAVVTAADRIVAQTEEPEPVFLTEEGPWEPMPDGHAGGANGHQ